MPDLVTLSQAKKFLRIEIGNTDEDAELTRQITAESARFLSLVGRDLLAASYVDRFDGTQKNFHVLAKYPVTAVASVVVDGVTIPAQPSATENGWFLLDQQAGSSDTGIVEMLGYWFCYGRGNCSISYTAGYALVDLPKEIGDAVLQLIAWQRNAKDHVAQASKNGGGETVTFVQYEVPLSVKSVAERYQRAGF